MKLFSLTRLQADYLREAAAEPGGAYIPCTSKGDIAAELIDGGAATVREAWDHGCGNYPDRHLVPTAHGLALLEKHLAPGRDRSYL